MHPIAATRIAFRKMHGLGNDFVVVDARRGDIAIDAAAARRHPARAFIDDCLDVYLGWPFIAASEVLMVARTDQTLMVQVDEFMQHYRRTMNEVWLAAFMRAGIRREEASFQMMTTLNMIRGMGMNSMWQRNMPHYKKLLHQWADTLEAGAFRGRSIELR